MPKWLKRLTALIKKYEEEKTFVDTVGQNAILSEAGQRKFGAINRQMNQKGETDGAP